ncbi:signal peptidase I [bacterium]|nr:signal peptidase I [bacterium]
MSKSTFHVIAEYAQALIGAVLLAVLIRGFLVEPFKIPSESMVPTLLVGDHIFVARYQYGLRVPLTKFWLLEFDEPERGDVVVFTYPEDENVDFIKRVIAVPGDVLAMYNGVLYVNSEKSTYQSLPLGEQNPDNQCLLAMTPELDKKLPDKFREFPYFLKYKKFDVKLETLPTGSSHMIQRSHKNPFNSDFEVTIPERQYFVMGDNRDYSHDSRIWGMVPRENLKGKAVFIWLSLNHEKTKCSYNLLSPEVFPNVRWDRFGRKII